MADRRRGHATWLLLVVFTGMCLGVCTTVLSASGGTRACCPDLGNGKASFTTCCARGEQSLPSELPLIIHAAPPPAEIAFVVTAPVAVNRIGQIPTRRSPFRSADPQALLSAFLI
jgi:hypothetical protein